MKLFFRCAESRADVMRCRKLIAEVYNRDYKVVFSEDHYDLAAKIEPWPHRFLMAFHENDLVANCLCYFGDQRSRERIEARLALKSSTTDS